MFSYEHVKLDSNKINSDYWDFSLDELAKYDVKANISYIRKVAKVDKISYVCHSQGCYQLFLSYTLDNKFFDDSILKVAAMGSGLRISKVVKIF